MNVWPVIQREMRTQAHAPATWQLRLASASVSVISLALLVWARPGMLLWQGTSMFVFLNFITVSLIGLVFPALTADSISSERRDGTLGLLFLTSLSPQDIVLGKASVQVIRALLLWGATIPAMFVPVLAGGVDLETVVSMVGVQLAMIPVALSSGLLASVQFVRTSTAVMGGYCFFLLNGCIFFGLARPLGGMVLQYTLQMDAIIALVLVTIIYVVLCVWLQLKFAVEMLGGNWHLARPAAEYREEPASGDESHAPVMFQPVEEVEHGEAEPRRPVPEGRPWDWLMTRQSARGAVGITRAGWGWLALLLSLLTSCGGAAHWVIYALLGLMSVVAGKGLRGERREGTLEMLLTVPVSEAELMRAQRRVLVHEFRPAIMVCVGFSVVLALLNHSLFFVHPAAVALVLAPFTLSAISAWAALLTRHAIIAQAGVIAVAWILPWLLSALASRLLQTSQTVILYTSYWSDGTVLFLVTHAVVAIRARQVADLNFRRRDFLLQTRAARI